MLPRGTPANPSWTINISRSSSAASSFFGKTFAQGLPCVVAFKIDITKAGYLGKTLDGRRRARLTLPKAVHYRWIEMSLEFAEILEKGHRTGRQLEVRLSSLKNHVLIAGGSGSGKTHLAKAMIEEIISAGVPTIAIDSHGDLLWLTRVKPGRSTKKQRLRTAPKKIFTPGFSEGFPFVIAPDLYSSTTEDKREFIRYWVRTVLRAIGHEHKPGQTSPEEYLLTKTSESILAGRELSLKTLLEESREQNATWTIDKTAPIAPDEAKALVSGLGALLGNEPNLYVGEPFRVRDLTSSGRGLWIIYLVPLPTETKQLVLNWLCETIYQWMMNVPATNPDRPRLILFIDEALVYVTESNPPEHKQALFSLLNEGRKYGVGLVLAVQTPRGLPPEVSNNCKTKFFGALDDPGDLAYVKRSTGLIDVSPLRFRSWKYAFVVGIPGKTAMFCKANGLLTRNGGPLTLKSRGMARILRFLHQFRPPPN
jgi:hypothetical protein